MKGLVRVTPESLAEILADIQKTMQKFKKEDYAEKQMIWSWRKFKKVEWIYYKGMPLWYQYKDSLVSHLSKLESMAIQSLKTGDEIWLSELSYCHLLMLSKGDVNANPIYIMNY